jgi:hypothetical protein
MLDSLVLIVFDPRSQHTCTILVQRHITLHCLNLNKLNSFCMVGTDFQFHNHWHGQGCLSSVLNINMFNTWMMT